jgi:hypothetical protein
MYDKQMRSATEVAGLVMVIAAVAMISYSAALFLAGVVLIVAAHNGDEESK